MHAMFLHRRADYLREKRFRDEARLRMMPRCRRQRATVSADEMLALAFFKAGRATEIRQNAKGRVDALLPRLALHLAQMLTGHLSSDFPHSRLQVRWRQLPLEHGQDQVNQRPVGFRENLFRVRGKRISGVRLPDPGLRARLKDKSIPLEAEEMRAHRVVGQLQGRGEIIHRLLLRAQQLENLPPRACEDPFAPTRLFHCSQHNRTDE